MVKLIYLFFKLAILAHTTGTHYWHTLLNTHHCTCGAHPSPEGATSTQRAQGIPGMRTLHHCAVPRGAAREPSPTVFSASAAGPFSGNPPLVRHAVVEVDAAALPTECLAPRPRDRQRVKDAGVVCVNLGSGASRHVLLSGPGDVVDVQLAIRADSPLCIPHDHLISLGASHADRGRSAVAARSAKEAGLVGFSLHAVCISDVGVEAARRVLCLQL
jgi:hypothetical protein